MPSSKRVDELMGALKASITSSLAMWKKNDVGPEADWLRLKGAVLAAVERQGHKDVDEWFDVVCDPGEDKDVVNVRPRNIPTAMVLMHETVDPVDVPALLEVARHEGECGIYAVNARTGFVDMELKKPLKCVEINLEV